MNVPFESLHSASRIWIYQSDKKFSESDKESISGLLDEFTARWAAHGQPLKASYTIRYNQFVILAADESFQSASGCSIDESVRVIKEIENATGHNLFNRNLVAFLKDNEVITLNLGDLKQKYADGIWNESTLTFNNLVQSKEQFEASWLTPAGNTWLKRYVPAQPVQF